MVQPDGANGNRHHEDRRVDHIVGAPADPETLLGFLESHSTDLIDDIGTLVSSESHSDDHEALAATADVLAQLIARRLRGEVEVVSGESLPIVLHRWASAPAVRQDALVSGDARHAHLDSEPIAADAAGHAPRRILLLGHFDTVWPTGTLERRPLSCADGLLRGPGVFDMKAGIVLGIWAVKALQSSGWEPSQGVEVLSVWTPDEEVGSKSSLATLATLANRADAALVLEPADGTNCKIVRKGVATYELEFTGRASHAGLEPWAGANALVEMAAQIPAITAIGSADGATTVTPTLASAGSAENSVPAFARLTVDTRAETNSEQRRVDDALNQLTPSLEGTAISVTRRTFRGPLEASASAGLYAVARRVASAIGISDFGGSAVGGGSDGNFLAGWGVRTLDGLGAVGAGAHAEDEHCVAGRLVERAALIAGLVAAIDAEPGPDC